MEGEGYLAHCRVLEGEEHTMAEGAVETQQRRLEDYIALAQQGKRVRVNVDLRKQPVRQKVHPEETADMAEEISMYLLLADFRLTADGESCLVTKVYAFGAEGEPLESARVNRNIATERLKMDYKRLKDANIAVDEKYF
jgi:hypothetical protein